MAGLGLSSLDLGLSARAAPQASGEVIAQSASFGDTTIEGGGGWRPQLDSGAVESLTSYDGLASGTLGSYTPSISSGRLVFTGGGAGAPDGVVLNCTGASGRSYAVTISEVANRRDVATATDTASTRASVTNNLGLTVVIRQNARISYDYTLGTKFLHSETSTESFGDASLTSPITVYGEGDFIEGEAHVLNWNSIFPSGITFDHLFFGDQKSRDSLTLNSNSSRPTRNLTVKNCKFQIEYDVDNLAVADWEGDGTGSGSTKNIGFNATGYAKARFIYCTGGWVQNLTVMDNEFLGGYVHLETNMSGVFLNLGNIHRRPYYDVQKSSHSGFPSARGYVRIEGCNLKCEPKTPSIYEDADTEPHFDPDQVTNGGVGPIVSIFDFNITLFPENVSVQGRFHNDRPAAMGNGHRWNSAGEMMMLSSLHTQANDWPDNLYVDKMVLLPGWSASLPVASTLCRFDFIPKAGEGGNAGVHYFKRSVFSGLTESGNAVGAIANSTITDQIDSQTLDSTAYNANFENWSDWESNSTPISPATHTDALEIFKPVAASSYAAISPYSDLTPGVTLASDYSVTDDLRPVPVLSNLTITTPASSAFTVDSDLGQSGAVIWAVFASEVTDADEIRLALSGSMVADQFGVAYAANDVTTITCAGRGTLASGTYWMCVAQFNGSKKSGVATIQFTVT